MSIGGIEWPSSTTRIHPSIASIASIHHVTDEWMNEPGQPEAAQTEEKKQQVFFFHSFFVFFLQFSPKFPSFYFALLIWFFTNFFFFFILLLLTNKDENWREISPLLCQCDWIESIEEKETMAIVQIFASIISNYAQLRHSIWIIKPIRNGWRFPRRRQPPIATRHWPKAEIAFHIIGIHWINQSEYKVERCQQKYFWKFAHCRLVFQLLAPICDKRYDPSLDSIKCALDSNS